MWTDKTELTRVLTELFFETHLRTKYRKRYNDPSVQPPSAQLECLLRTSDDVINLLDTSDGRKDFQGC
jgi:hypothetical protein